MAEQLKEKTLTIRVTEALYEDIEKVHGELEANRDPHYCKVTKTEELMMLIKLGL
jgi:hypothetical protein